METDEPEPVQGEIVGEILRPRSPLEAARELEAKLLDLARRVEDPEVRMTTSETGIELKGLALAVGVLGDRTEGPNFSSAIVDAMQALRPRNGSGPPVERIEVAMHILGDALR